MPGWAGAMAQGRDYFRDSVLAVQEDANSEKAYFKFLYAVQPPTYIALCPLSKVDRALVQQRVTHDNWHTCDPVRECFHCNYAAMTSAEELYGVDASAISVLAPTLHQGGQVMTTEMLEEPLQTFLSMVPEPEKAPPAAKKQKTDQDHKEALVLAFPWLE
eukprot:7244456-Lingulodinium_polyedra.AAC.1